MQVRILPSASGPLEAELLAGGRSNLTYRSRTATISGRFVALRSGTS